VAAGVGIIRSVSSRLALFAYGSLVSRSSAERTLVRRVEDIETVRLPGWRRRWSLARDNLRCEKTFARPDGSTPAYCLGLNLEPDAAGGPAPNGALYEVTAAELDRLSVREIRYDKVEVTDSLGPAAGSFDRAFAFTAKPENFAPSPPSGAVIISAYALAVEAAFEELGPTELDAFRKTTGPYPVDVIDATLVRGRIPLGNPREW
jgi:cation transport regulator ChaC